uniref:W2 domain-containing protein n=1 Tax=Caenorhabditis tropicalis TaxID=1561998 RepID=A0A1I7U206_9PELO
MDQKIEVEGIEPCTSINDAEVGEDMEDPMAIDNENVCDKEFIELEEENLAGPTFRTPEFLKLCIEYGVEDGELSPPMLFEDMAGLNATKFVTRNSLEDYLAGPTFRTLEFLKLCVEFGVEDGDLREVWEEEFIQHKEEDYLAGPKFRTPEFLKVCVEYGVGDGELSPPMLFEDMAGLNARRTPEFLKKFGTRNSFNSRKRIWLDRHSELQREEQEDDDEEKK